MQNQIYFTEKEICPLTGWKAYNISEESYLFHYSVKAINRHYQLYVLVECFENKEIITNKHIFRWLLFSDKIPSIKNQQDFLSPTKKLITPKMLLNIMSESYIPTTPEEMYNQFIVDLFKIFPLYQGQVSWDDLISCTLFKTKQELNLYLDALSEKGLIAIKKSSTIASPYTGMVVDGYDIKIKFEGIDYVASLAKKGIYSKNCFVAMSFSASEKSKYIRESIKSAVSETGYNPILIDDTHFDSDRTINDAIIAEIKRAKFLIADFTEQKNGVYFEAGFGLGHGLPVIYCCDQEDFEKNSHFDVKHYPHVLHNSPEELRKKLIDKINAFIK